MKMNAKYQESTTLSFFSQFFVSLFLAGSPQWGAADAEIKVPSGENTEL